jgi:hypothetical protein
MCSNSTHNTPSRGQIWLDEIDDVKGGVLTLYVTITHQNENTERPSTLKKNYK